MGDVWGGALNHSGSDEGGRIDWGTPWWMVRLLAEELIGGATWDLDPCCDGAHNARADAWYTPESDGLRHPWYGNVFVNPPYDRVSPAKWAQKIVREVASRRVRTVAVLTPARTDTRWWWILADHSQRVRLLQGRVYHVHPVDPLERQQAPFPSTVFVLRSMACAEGCRAAFERWDIREIQRAAHRAEDAERAGQGVLL